MAETYDTVIGLEVHVQLATRTKMFSSATCAAGRDPNTQVDPVSLGLPGTLPVANARAVELAVLAAVVLEGTVNPHSRFDRKHYFYPDLPKNYQISQYDEPYCSGGMVEIDLPDGGTRRIPLTRIHLEEDAGKLVHQESGTCSEVDLNRAGTPLIEIVSEPAISSPAEAYAYLVELRRILRWHGVSDCEMQHGSLRCDANISIRPVGTVRLGTKVEIKNLNSLRAVEAACAYEVQRQAALAKAGRYAEVVQETRLWDPDAKVTRPMRGKEGAADYRYFPDPDLPPLLIPAAQVQAARAAAGETPRQRAVRFVQTFGLSPALASELTMERSVSEYVEALIAQGLEPRLAANWTREEGLRLLAETGRLPDRHRLAALIALVAQGRVARVVAKGEIDRVLASPEPVEAYFTSRGMIQAQDHDRLAAWVAQVLAENAKAAEDVRQGKLAAIGRLVGLTMKLSGGQADPKQVKVAVERALGVG